jgi:hypothetical protein
VLQLRPTPALALAVVHVECCGVAQWSGNLLAMNAQRSGAKLCVSGLWRYSRGPWAALVLVSLIFAGLALSDYAWASTARSNGSKAMDCDTIFARNYFNGKDVRIAVVRHADCRTARGVLRYYYNSGAPCAGSGCALTTPSGWSCDTNPGEVQQKTGVITICEKGLGIVESHIVRGAAVAAECTGVHAGQGVGDGEYSDGAMLNAKGISCRAALALVKPRYHAILEGKGPFTLGKFRCTRSFDGPNTLKTCVDGSRRFQFL